ncbi:MAG: hypothetical protein IKZ96_03340 [Bacilli bacterium]|nr:hypothetical protein [Bacilli bacterium]
MNNRKQILKNMKKERKLRNNYTEDNENIITRFVGTIFGVLIVLVISYLLVGIFVTKTIKFGKDKEEPTVATTDKSTILIGNIFNQKEEEYLVVIYDINNKEDQTITTWLNYYSGKNSDTTIYKVDSKNKMNAKYIVEKDSNREAKEVSELKVIAPTIIRIKNGSISEYIEGESSVKEMLKN